ncbi:MAG: glycoside hydrolase family 127 protein [Acidobacteriaceae bacterium]|nr:glycoside hydrolase family 127 protein [Acidobacteriaceae bacterium]
MNGRLFNRTAIALLASLSTLAAQTPPASSLAWSNEGVIYLDHSLNARLHTVPVQAVHMRDGFWTDRRRVTTERSLPTMLTELEEHGVVDNFRRLEGRTELPRKGRASSDSDLYKWIEAAAWALASNETSAGDKSTLRSNVESFISIIVAAQEPTGYLNTYFTGDKARLRFTDLSHSHEDFCLGHLLQAGIAYYRATGNRRLLDAGIRIADYLIQNFGPDKRPFFTGHPELEMAMVELYRTTGQTSYLGFTRYLFSGVERDRLKLKDSDIRYMFSGKPFTSHTEFEGHAVRGLYAASGATDYYTETGDPAYRKTLDLLWTDLTLRKMYITGGVGSRSAGESFGDAYELPSESAYAESCAAVANVMWNFRLLMMTGDARYSDILETTLYNGANAGMSLGGNLYCYRNPLASTGEKLRNPWYDVTCCPPNLERLFESLPGYLYGVSRDGVYVNLYHSSELDWHLQDGTGIQISQTTDYPWSGAIRLRVSPAKPADFTVYIRWPRWAQSIGLEVNGAPVQVAAAQGGSYIPISRRWQPGDSIAIDFPMPATPIIANPRVADDYGRIAVQRGPLVYALEQIDQSGAALGDIFYRTGSSITAEPKKDLLGGITLLKSSGQVAEKSLGEEPLYQPLTLGANRAKRPVTLTFIPYYAIGNREPTPMEVWVPMTRMEGSTPSLAGGGFDRHSETK